MVSAFDGPAGKHHRQGQVVAARRPRACPARSDARLRSARAVDALVQWSCWRCWTNSDRAADIGIGLLHAVQAGPELRVLAADPAHAQRGQLRMQRAG